MAGKKNGFNRRDFLKKSAGAAGLLAVLSAAGIPALRASAAAGDGDAGAARKSGRQWCMTIDLRKCEGCVTVGTAPNCTQSCINGHFVPGGQQWIQVFEVELPGGGSFFMPTPCYQCENAPCVNVCPVAATYHSEEGIVLIDHHRCIGCRFCMSACPYHRRFFNWGTPKLPPEAAFVEYSPLYPVPAVKGTVIKCMFCAHLLHDGKLPFCVQGCPMKAIYMGDLNEDLASNGVETVVLSRFLKENNAYRFKVDLGTQPRVFYIPGHGESFKRQAGDERHMHPPTWPWADEQETKLGVWPWDKSDTWTWEAEPR